MKVEGPQEASTQPELHKAGEELAVLLQSAAPKLKLKKPRSADE